MKRVGHKGAHLIEHGNTIASFDAALHANVDMIEFDVIRWHGRLVIAHDPGAAASGQVLTLEEALDYLAGERFAAISFDVDMKHQGFEDELVAALYERGLQNRCIVSTMHPRSLARVRAQSGDLKCGISIPRVTRDWMEAPAMLRPLVYAAVLAHRVYQPALRARQLRAGKIDAVMAHFAIVSSRLVKAVHDAGGELYVWTVDDDKRIAKLAAMGVDGIITNDPRLFDSALVAGVAES